MKAILEIEMPESCSDCPQQHWKQLGEDYVCYKGFVTSEYEDTRHPDCPLKIVEEDETMIENEEVEVSYKECGARNKDWTCNYTGGCIRRAVDKKTCMEPKPPKEETLELRPCPFCGGEPRFIYTSDTVTFFNAIRCDDCFATIERGCNKEDERRHILDNEIIAAWNKRSEVKND